ncbi:RNA-binding protein EWS [Plecturocebus cupreus]
MGVYGQESGGFSGPGENRSMSGPDNRGRGRGGFGRGGTSRGGLGEGLGGMGSAGERGGFNKPGGPMDEGPDLDLGPTVDPDEDSDNSAIYVQGLNDNVTLDDLADFFKQCGVVKMNKRTGQPMIRMYLDKETGKPTVSYEDPPIAKAAMEWFDCEDFQGGKLKVSLAQKKPPMNSMRGSVPPREGREMPSVEVQEAQEVLGDPWVTWEAMEETEEASLPEDPGVPEGTPPEEETSSTELETGSVPVRVMETRTWSGEQSATSLRSQSLKASSHHPSPLRVVIVAEVALVACGEEEVTSWLLVVPVECSEVAVVETEVASMVAWAWTEVALVEEDEVALGCPWTFDGTDGRKKRRTWRTSKNG